MPVETALMSTAILLLAAGASRRFGPENKLLAPLEGKPLVRHAADAARAVPADVYLVAISDPDLAELFPDFRKVLVDPDLPQSASLKAGVAVAAALTMTRVLVVLGDMPRVSTTLMTAVLDRAGDLPSAATDGRTILPPACLPAAIFPAIAALAGDQGAGAILRHLPPAQCVLASAEDLVDIDRPADLTALKPRR
jgi:CTP:molybdopterin cytidylyltransferase MocA